MTVSRMPADANNMGPGGESDDLFDADGALTRAYLLRRGYCCENGCRNCPYGFRERGSEPALRGSGRPEGSA